jgi:phosphoserine phosphatase RsbU/P
VSCAAGHPPPLHVTAGGLGPVGDGGPLLGVLDRVLLAESTVELAPGDALVVYTDGVPEARRPDGDFYGEDRLLRHMASGAGHAHDRVTTLLADVLDFQHGVARDDIAVVVLRVRQP